MTFFRKQPANFVALLMIIAIVSNCRQSETFPDLVAGPVLDRPIWHPSGKIIGFNFRKNETIFSPFATLNSDDRAVRIQTSYPIYNPTWSPDGKWLAYSNGKAIYKLPFDGVSLDTTKKVQLTSEALDAYQLTWAADSKSIYFTSVTQTAGTGGLFKLTIDSKRVDTILRCDNEISFISDPFLFEGKKLLIARVNNNITQVATIDTLGGLLQITASPNNGPYPFTQPQFYNGRIYFGSNGIFSMKPDGSDLQKLNDYSYYGFSISQQGQIAYTHLKASIDYSDVSAVDSLGQLWIMQADGSGNHYFSVSR